MTTIANAYINALLADAAYVDVARGVSVDDIKDALETRMTPTLAAYIAANFEVASIKNTSDNPLPLVGGSGFDATVWRVKPGSELAGFNNENAGKVYVSMRGTEPLPGADVFADRDLTFSTGAFSPHSPPQFLLVRAIGTVASTARSTGGVGRFTTMIQAANYTSRRTAT